MKSRRSEVAEDEQQANAERRPIHLAIRSGVPDPPDRVPLRNSEIYIFNVIFEIVSLIRSQRYIYVIYLFGDERARCGRR
jgi:hypothetical protein